MWYQIKTEEYKVVVLPGELTLASLSGGKTLQKKKKILEMVLFLGGKAKETHGERMAMMAREDSRFPFSEPQKTAENTYNVVKCWSSHC